MLIGPVFTREATISPRRPRTYIARGVYGGLLLLLTITAWLVMTGNQLIVDTGDFSRFGAALFRLLTPIQLILILFFAAVSSASAVAQEKDRKTFLLLLLTHLSNSELVLGKLLASLLEIVFFVLISLPIFLILSLLGGVSYPQIFRSVLVTLLGALVCGSLGSCLALWRDKTFQAVAMTTLILVIGLGLGEAVYYGWLGESVAGLSATSAAAAISPWRAIWTAMSPSVETGNSAFWTPIQNFLILYAALFIVINGIAILFVRVWNPSRELRQGAPEEDTWRKEAKSDRLEREAAERQSALRGVHASQNPYDNLKDNLFAQAADEANPSRENELSTQNAAADVIDAATGKVKMDPSISAAGGKVRHVWDNPILWREICTRAYGRRNFIIRLVYFLLFIMSAITIRGAFLDASVPTLSAVATPLVPLLILSFLLVNAQAVTSLTSERDGGTFVLLLASDLSPREFVYGKLGGTLYNMKEIILLPLILCGFIWFWGGLSLLNALFLFGGLAALYFFAAMVGIHIGMQYLNTRSALATSLGIVFFLFVGVGTCIWIMLAFSGSFESQLQPFLAFMIGGGVGLYLCLGARNPSKAIALASFILPFATFYAITCFLLGQIHWVFLAVVGAYLFTTIAMLIPAIDEFDVATGRTTAD